MLCIMLKRNKESYFSKLFESIWNNLKNNLERNKIIKLKDISTSVPRTVNDDNSNCHKSS